jgi:hypothetical protein
MPGRLAKTKMLAQTADEARLKLQASLGSTPLSSVKFGELLSLEITEGVRFGDDLVELPGAWFPAGRLQDFSKRCWRWALLETDQHPTGSKGYFAARLAVVPICVAMWMVPTTSGNGNRSILLKPSTFIQRVRCLIWIARDILESGQFDDASGAFFKNLPSEVIKGAFSRASRAFPSAIPGLVAQCNQYYGRKIIDDWIPGTTAADLDGNEPRPTPEKKRRHEEIPTPAAKESKQWLPLPDAFVSEAGWRCLWIIENLGPPLIRCAAEVHRAGLHGAKRKHDKLSETAVIWRRETIISAFFGPSCSGRQDQLLPFAISNIGRHQIARRSMTQILAIPDFWALRQYLSLLQSCHLFVVGLTMAGRWSEVVSLSRNCLVPEVSTNGNPMHVKGRSYKLVDQVGGISRNWPLHEIAVLAIRQQIELANVLAPGIQEVWVSKGRRNSWSYLSDPGRALTSLARTLDLEHLLGGTSFHVHRFRKTIARLTALALVGAPKILMDLFGHRSIEMTLRYILSDPMIAAEIEQIAKDMVILLGKEAIESVADNGGPAAVHLQSHVQERLASLGSSTLNSDRLQEVAEILTANGKAIALVRPGVLCTKQPGQAGPCTRGVGHPDASRCKVSCDYRLELAAARADAQRAITDCISFLRDPETKGNEIMSAFWISQVKAHVVRFKDLAGQLSNHPELVQVMK